MGPKDVAGVVESRFMVGGRAIKPRKLPYLPQGKRVFPSAAYRKRSRSLKQVPACHFQQDRVENARATSHVNTAQAGLPLQNAVGRLNA